MKRVLQISNYLYPNIGGIEQIAKNIADTLSLETDIEQKIICFNETASRGGYSCKRGETVHDWLDGVEVIRCGCITKQMSQSISLSFGKELRAVLDSFQPDIVIFHYPNPFEAFFLKRHLKRGCKLILYWHLDIVKQKRLAKLFEGQTFWLLKRADKIIATSPTYIDGSPYLSAYREKCLVIPNCIDENRLQVTEEIRRRSLEIRKQNEGKILCFSVGRHVPYKGFRYLIASSAYLDNRFRLFIGGEGELTGELKKMAADDGKIVFLGKLKEQELIAYYLAADIFCFPSITKNEAFGIALAEAMYFGTPAVTFHIPGSGVNYVSVKDVTGLEVRNRDSAAYAEAIRTLAENAELRERMGRASKSRVDGLFLTGQFQKSIRDIIRSL